MKFNFQYGDKVAIIVDGGNDNTGEKRVSCSAQDYRNLEWIRVTNTLDPEKVTHAVFSATANLVFWGVQPEVLQDKGYVSQLVRIMAENRDLAGLVFYPSMLEGSGDRLELLEPYEIPNRLLDDWLSPEGRAGKEEFMPLCFYRSAMRQSGYFPPQLPLWYPSQSFFRYGRFYRLGLLNLGNQRLHHATAGEDEILLGLDMLYNSENDSSVRKRLLASARRVFDSLEVKEKMRYFRRHPTFTLRILLGSH